VIESRQWKIVQNAGSPAWTLAAQKARPRIRGSRSLTSRGSISIHRFMTCSRRRNLSFSPMLPRRSPPHLTVSQFDSMTSAFGAGIGTFQWRERTYSYVVVKELPCFKPAK